MASVTMKKSLEEVLQMPASAIKDKLPSALDEIRQYGIGKLLEEYPDFMAQLLNQLKKNGASRFFTEVTGVADQLLDLLWEGVALRAEQLPDMKAVLGRAERMMRVNIEASDSPFKSHFVVKGGRITGHSGLLHYKEEDFRFMGPTDVMIELLLGDLHLGFSNLRLQTAGHSGWFSRVGPVVREINKVIKGGKEIPKVQMGH